MIKAQDDSKVRQDEKRTDIQYQIGDLVFIKFPNLADSESRRQFSAHFAGPYQVMRKVRENTYECKSLLSPSKKEITVSSDRMKLYAVRPQHLQVRSEEVAQLQPVVSASFKEAEEPIARRNRKPVQRYQGQDWRK